MSSKLIASPEPAQWTTFMRSTVEEPTPSSTLSIPESPGGILRATQNDTVGSGLLLLVVIRPSMGQSRWLRESRSTSTRMIVNSRHDLIGFAQTIGDTAKQHDEEPEGDELHALQSAELLQVVLDAIREFFEPVRCEINRRFEGIETSIRALTELQSRTPHAPQSNDRPGRKKDPFVRKRNKRIVELREESGKGGQALCDICKNDEELQRLAREHGVDLNTSITSNIIKNATWPRSKRRREPKQPTRYGRAANPLTLGE